MPAPLPQLGADGRILEGIVTTYNKDGTVNISPMGPIVDEDLTCFVLRPFQTSTTYKNLQRAGQGVLHVTDDVMLFAQAALGQPDPFPSLDGLIIRDACHWYAFEVLSMDDSHDRVHVVAKRTQRGSHREFFGFNRAKHAVLEAAILATRVHLLAPEEIQQELLRLETPVRKTASQAERQAFEFLKEEIVTRIESANNRKSLA